jgi:hypothetical protein
MATRNYVTNHPNGTLGINGFFWENLTQTDLDGQPVVVSRRSDRTVQVIGTFGGATVTIQGSLDGATWATLNDLQGTAMTFTAARIEGVSEIVTYIRPLVSSASETTDLDVYLLEVGGAL